MIVIAVLIVKIDIASNFTVLVALLASAISDSS